MEEKLNHYLKSEVIDRFEINKIFDCPLLNDWISIIPNELKPSHQDVLEEARIDLSYKWGEWNEEELKMKFLAFLFFISEMEEKGKIQVFYEI